MAGDCKAAAELAELSAQQPEAELTDPGCAPGAGDERPGRMAAAVASHFETTPHTVETGRRVSAGEGDVDAVPGGV